jgi:hypothetical protein
MMPRMTSDHGLEIFLVTPLVKSGTTFLNASVTKAPQLYS